MILDQRSIETIKNNIRQAMKRLKKSGTTRMSVNNLMQVTPTKGLVANISPRVYAEGFTEIAKEVCGQFINV